MLGQSQSGDPRKNATVGTVAELALYPNALRSWGLRVNVEADGLTRVLTRGVSSTSLLDNGNWRVEGSPDNLADVDVYDKQRSYVGDAATGRSHPVADVTSGPSDATYHVEATIVAMASAGSTGGSLVIAGTFKKNTDGELSQIGATQTLYGPIEDIAGALAASFVISPSLLALEVLTATAGQNCITHCSCRVVSVTNDI